MLPSSQPIRIIVVVRSIGTDFTTFPIANFKSIDSQIKRLLGISLFIAGLDETRMQNNRFLLLLGWRGLEKLSVIFVHVRL